MELLPCPFCGGKASFDHDDNGWNWVVCGKCGVTTDCRTHTMEDCHPLLAEQWNRRASPASAPEGFKHDIGADRFTVVQGSYWWHVRAGEGTQNIGKFHTKRAAEEMALTLLTAFRDGAFMQYQAMLAAAPTPPVSEDKDKIIAAANALENIASTSSSTRIRRVANEALTAIRARRNHG